MPFLPKCAFVARTAAAARSVKFPNPPILDIIVERGGGGGSAVGDGPITAYTFRGLNHAAAAAAITPIDH